MPDFKWEDLKDKKVLGGRKGGMPEMVFEYILRKNGLDPDVYKRQDDGTGHLCECASSYRSIQL